MEGVRFYRDSCTAHIKMGFALGLIFPKDIVGLFVLLKGIHVGTHYSATRCPDQVSPITAQVVSFILRKFQYQVCFFLGMHTHLALT